jgi:hypothetical protein
MNHAARVTLELTLCFQRRRTARYTPFDIAVVYLGLGDLTSAFGEA